MRHTTASFAFVMLLSGSAFATPVFNETLVHDTTTTVEIDLNASTVLCSSADYGALFLKIGIPKLAALTLLDHQNIGAGAPCVSAGACYPGHEPADILDPSKPTETVAINVKAFRLDEADAAAQTCTTTLIERVHVNVRGFDFLHERQAPLGSRPFADCDSSNVAPTDPDQPADDPGSVDEPKTGGCSTTGGTGGVLLALGALVAIRRRRR
jgi:MYXO-CTERM domain-containing protein